MDIKYYEEFTEDESTWRNIGRPPVDETWKRKLESFVINGKPLKVVWGGQEEIYVEGDDDVPAGFYHKYQVGNPFEKVIGYKWTENGQEKFVSALNGEAEIPEKAFVIPVYEFVSVGRPRWVVEVWREEGAGVDYTGYHEAWTIEHLELLSSFAGKRELLSRFAEPNEIDIKRAEHLKYLCEHLTDKEIDREQEKKAEWDALQKQKRETEEFEINKEEFEQFLVDNRNREFEYDAPEIDANAYLKQLQKAHQEHAKQYE